jgi:hypothetical protein
VSLDLAKLHPFAVQCNISTGVKSPPTFKGRKEKEKGDESIQVIIPGNVTMKHPV